MTTLTLGGPARRGTVDTLPDGAPTDAELLARWAIHPDPAILEQLVRRHGGMVLGVCRRVLGHSADADDAFQATFLVLVRKARTLTQPGQVAGWLYGVAFRIARRVRADRARRRRREASMFIETPAPPAPDDTSDLRRVLDEELARLPEKYRLPIVLCELEERTLDEAARELGWPKGTVAGRLSRGRNLLRSRLSRRRGLIVPVIILGGPVLPAAAATPSDTLVTATVTVAAQPDGPVGHPATVLADTHARVAKVRRGRLLIAALLAVLLSVVVGRQSVAVLNAAPAVGSTTGGCHSNG